MGMGGIGVAGRSAPEEQLERIARMPADADTALARLKNRVRSAWRALPADSAPLYFQKALAAATPGAACLLVRPAASLDALLAELDRGLATRHPEEIRVFCFTLLGSLFDLVREDRGPAEAATLLHALEHRA
jgi:hypothetical protein